MHKNCLHCLKSLDGITVNRDRRKFCDHACSNAARHTPEANLKRFWAKVQKADGDACWTWHGARSSVSGYGTFSYQGHNINAHRAAWLLTHGPIEGKDVDVLHRCHNGHLGCVRPDHLKLGSHAENMAEAAAAGRTTKGERSAKAKITEVQALEILKAKPAKVRGSKRIHQELAARHGISSGAVMCIWRGDSWGHLQ